jgi:hypothetical protein
VTMTGSIQQVVAQLDKLNPNWKKDFNFNDTAVVPSKLAKRDNFNSFFCGGRWKGCSLSAIKEGITYLNGVTGQPRSGPGPGLCGRVSCSYKAAIWWCNDVSFYRNNISYTNSIEFLRYCTPWLRHYCSWGRTPCIQLCFRRFGIWPGFQ